MAAVAYTSVSNSGGKAVFNTASPHGMVSTAYVRNESTNNDVPGYKKDAYVISTGTTSYKLTTVSGSASDAISYISDDQGTTTPLIVARFRAYGEGKAEK